MQWLYSVQMQLFDGYQDVNNNRISAAAAVLVEYILSIRCAEINLPQEKPSRFSSLKRISFSK